jgi:uncharacterized protein DUF5338
MNAPVPSTKPRLGAGRVAFLARKEAIAKKIEAGYPLIMIYREYENLLPIGYAQFSKYANKYLKSKPEELEAPPFQHISEEFPDYYYDNVHFTLQVYGVVRISRSEDAPPTTDIKINTTLTLDEINGSSDLSVISKCGLFRIEQAIYERLSGRFKELGYD